MALAEPRFSRGEVWLVDFGSDPARPEQAFQRPVVVVSDDRLNHPGLQMVVVVPGTSRLRHLSLHLEVEPDASSGLTVATAFQTAQIRAVSDRRMERQLGVLSAAHCHALDEILRLTLAL